MDIVEKISIICTQYLRWLLFFSFHLFKFLLPENLLLRIYLKKKKNFTIVTHFQKFIFLYPRNPSRISTRYPYHARALVSSVRRKVASTASLMAKYGSPATFTSLLPFFSFQVLGHRVQILATHESRVEERFPPTLIFQTIALFLLRRRARRIVSRNLG